MTGVPDPKLSRAVLVGVAHYRTLRELGAVGNNLPALAEALRSYRIWGLPARNCAIVEDPVTADDMLDPVVEAAREATDTFLFYYAGHGLIDPRRSELHLTLVGSDTERMYKAVPYGLVRDALLDSRAARRIVVLDCCYSGRALGQMSGSASAVADEASAEGTYVLAAAAENKTALAPPGQRYTAFTGELLNIIQNGITGHGALLDLDSIYQQLMSVMRNKGLPIPQKRDRNTAGQLTLVHNQAFPSIAASDKAATREIWPSGRTSPFAATSQGIKPVADVLPQSIGIETKGGVFTEIIRRDTSVPVKRLEVFTTADDNQRTVEISIFQGEHKKAADNKKLGKFTLSDITPLPRGVPQIEVAFQVDANGMLTVTAKDLTTGARVPVAVSG